MNHIQVQKVKENFTALGTFRVAMRVGYIPGTSYTDIIYFLIKR